MPIYNRENKFLDIYNGSQYLHTIYHKESGDKSIIPWTYEMTTTTSNGYFHDGSNPTGSLSPSIQFSQWELTTVDAVIWPNQQIFIMLLFPGTNNVNLFSRFQIYRIDNSGNNPLVFDISPSDMQHNYVSGANEFLSQDLIDNPFANETRKFRVLIYE